MARVPIIDSPCPLSATELEAIDGHCGRCGKTVHSLDGMDDGDRAALLGNAQGALCVSYRLPVGLGAAMALTMAAPMMAQGVPPQAATHGTTMSPGATDVPAPTPAASSPKKESLLIFLGGVRDPKMAKWVEDMSLPELPTAIDTDAGD